MISILIWGSGEGAKRIVNNIFEENVRIIAFVDNSVKMQGKELYGKEIIAPDRVKSLLYDYLVIGTFKYSEVNEQLSQLGLDDNRVINYYEFSRRSLAQVGQIADVPAVVAENLSCYIDDRLEKLTAEIRNQPYELTDIIRKQTISLPKVLSIEETIEKIIEERISVSRFGDGEFDLCFGKAINFQETNMLLGNRMKDILKKKEKNWMPCLFDIFGKLADYRETTQLWARKYMNQYREKIYNLLNLENQYGNAYISRPYMIYQDKGKRVDNIFDMLKKIWCDRDILLIEGVTTRFGCGNDLLEGCKSVKRILVPNKDAFSKYDEILNAAVESGDAKLLLLAIGPTATVLAYDLAKSGFWALDVGHLDVEYEWFLSGVQKETRVAAKAVNEAGFGQGYFVENGYADEVYEGQILKRIH